MYYKEHLKVSWRSLSGKFKYISGNCKPSSWQSCKTKLSYLDSVWIIGVLRQKIGTDYTWKLHKYWKLYSRLFGYIKKINIFSTALFKVFAASADYSRQLLEFLADEFPETLRKDYWRIIEKCKTLQRITWWNNF